MDFDEMKDAIRRAQEADEMVSTPGPVQADVDLNVEMITKWLSTKHTTLWSDWSIDDDKGKAKAAEWLYRELESLVQFAMSQLVKT